EGRKPGEDPARLGDQPRPGAGFREDRVIGRDVAGPTLGSVRARSGARVLVEGAAQEVIEGLQGRGGEVGPHGEQRGRREGLPRVGESDRTASVRGERGADYRESTAPTDSASASC